MWSVWHPLLWRLNPERRDAMPPAHPHKCTLNKCKFTVESLNNPSALIEILRVSVMSPSQKSVCSRAELLETFFGNLNTRRDWLWWRGRDLCHSNTISYYLIAYFNIWREELTCTPGYPSCLNTEQTHTLPLSTDAIISKSSSYFPAIINVQNPIYLFNLLKTPINQYFCSLAENPEPQVSLFM